MKKTAVYALSLMIAGAVSLSSCNNAASTATPAAETAKSETNQEQGASLNIRYVDGDSIMARYNMAKDVQDFMLKTQSRLSNTEQSRATEIQRLASQIEEKTRNNGYLSQESYEADMRRIQKMQQDAQNVLASLSRIAEQEIGQQQLALNDSIIAFINDYNREHGYDAILLKSAGLYFNPALDITNEVIEGLNRRYNKVSSK